MCSTHLPVNGGESGETARQNISHCEGQRPDVLQEKPVMGTGPNEMWYMEHWKYVRKAGDTDVEYYICRSVINY